MAMTIRLRSILASADWQLNRRNSEQGLAGAGRSRADLLGPVRWGWVVPSRRSPLPVGSPEICH